MDNTVVKTGSAQTVLFWKVYFWMSLALAITGLTSWLVSGNPTIMNLITGSRAAFWILIILQFGMVMYLSARVMSMSLQAASVMFVFYSFLTGVTFSFIFLVYAKATIATCFFITAGMFLVMSIYGFFTKRDLSSWGNILIMALIGIVISSVVNTFLRSSVVYYTILYVWVVFFSGLRAYSI